MTSPGRVMAIQKQSVCGWAKIEIDCMDQPPLTCLFLKAIMKKVQ